jgi:signal transduction histidine kinase
MFRGTFGAFALFMFGVLFSLPTQAQKVLTPPIISPATQPITAAELVHLHPDQASQSLAVRVHGVVTYIAYNPPLMFLQDESGGICVAGPRERATVRIGSMVEVEGVTAPGRVGAYVTSRPRETVKVTVLEEQNPPPSARPVPLGRLGSLDSAGQFIETTAVVRSTRTEVATPAGGQEVLILSLASGRDRAEAAFFGWNNNNPRFPAPRPGTTVRIRGVFNAAAPERQQIAANRLLIPALRDLQTVTPASQPFTLAPTSIAAIRDIPPQDPLPTRARISGGIVTCVVPGKGFYLQDASAALWVESAPRNVRPGDHVDLVGFPARRGPRTILEDAEWRSDPTATWAIRPPLVTADQALAGNLDSELVQLEALVIGVSRLAEGPTLVLQSGERVFLARYAATAPAVTPSENSWVRVTGVCVNNRLLEASDAGNPGSTRPLSFLLLLPQPDSVQLIAAPSWFTLRHVLLILAGVFAVTLLAFAWVFALRRRVARQTRLLTEHLARETLNDERMRIARDLHDSLEQDLLGITMQLTATEKLLQQPGKAREALHLAAAMVRRSQAETHRAVWDLRAGGGNGANGHDLIDNLRQAVAGLSPAAGPKVDVCVTGEPAPLPPAVENHLQRVALEAVTNAIKHAAATRIRITLDYSPTQITLQVSDNGHGFDPAALPPPNAGHFGLFGMRERADKLKGQLDIQSSPATGTTIRLTISQTISPAGR